MKGFPRNATARAQHPAVVCETESLTYQELDARASRLALALAALGLDEGGRLGIMLPNGIEAIECLAATAKLAATSTTFNWHLPPDELAWMVADADVGVLVADPDLATPAEEAARGWDAPVVWSGDDYEARLAAAGDGDVPYRWPTHLPMTYTSGTTGRPKGVVPASPPDPAAMEADHDELIRWWAYGPDDVHLVAGPLYHPDPAAFSSCALYAGGTVVLMESWEPREFLRQVEAHRVTTTFLTPAHFIRLLEVPERQRRSVDVSSLRHVVHAGTPCPQVVKADFMAAFPLAEVWELYSMGEGDVTRASPEEWRARPGTVGRPWPGVGIEIRRPGTDEPLPAGQDGLVWVRPSRGRFRYHADDELTSRMWRDDHFATGDVGHLDDDGYLFLTDRLVDLVERGGVRVAPSEVEEVLHRHPEVVDCTVLGVPDRQGAELLALVETRGDVSAADLADYCTGLLDAPRVPSMIELCDQVPRDLNGTVLKRRLRDPGAPGSP